MASAPKDTLLKTYVPADLAAEVGKAAGTRGVSVSHLIRDALRQGVGWQGPGSGR